MDLSLYKTTELEQWISNKYRQAGIYYASDIDIERIAAIFDFEIRVTSNETKAIYDDEDCLIKLNGYLDEPRKRAAFFHEICHPLRHAGIQHSIPRTLWELQETQAHSFQLYAAMPFYMVLHYEDYLHTANAIPLMAYEFNLPPELVRMRMEQIQRRISQERFYQQIANQGRSFRVRYDYTPETQRILAQLHRQIEAKKGII